MSQVSHDGYGRPDVSVDIVLMTVKEGKLHVFLTKRPQGSKPDSEVGKMSLPGGYIHIQDDIDAEGQARRVLMEKVGITPPYLEQLYTFTGMNRDSRGWSVAISYYALVPEDILGETNIDDKYLIDVDQVPDLAFDHNDIIQKALSRLRSKATYSALPLFLLPETFVFQDMYDLYKKVLGVNVNIATFRRRVEVMGFLEEVAGETKRKTRPAQVYKMREGALHSDMVF